MLTDAEIRAAFPMLTGFHPRNADVEVVKQLGGTDEVLADYIWDHWMGEPDTPTIEQVLELVQLSHAELTPEQVRAELDATDQAAIAGNVQPIQLLRAMLLTIRFPELGD